MPEDKQPEVENTMMYDAKTGEKVVVTPTEAAKMEKAGTHVDSPAKVGQKRGQNNAS